MSMQTAETSGRRTREHSLARDSGPATSRDEAPVQAPSFRLVRTGAGAADASLATHLGAYGPLPGSALRADGAASIGRLVEEAGLTGRGGAGFSSATKLRLLAESGREPLLAVNAMEGEPASGKDAMLLSTS
ncbi:MAG: hypothetical protein JWO62_2018, partial [Acidimicrobiaceae bacterium]|nr:hypothetical protein [Acidimicrobiaceae bacterium]